MLGKHLASATLGILLSACSVIEVLNTEMGPPADVVAHSRKRSLEELDRLSATTRDYIARHGEIDTLGTTDQLLQKNDFYKQRIVEYRNLRIARYGFGGNPIVCGQARVRDSSGLVTGTFLDFIASPAFVKWESTNGKGEKWDGDPELGDAFDAGIKRGCK